MTDPGTDPDSMESLLLAALDSATTDPERLRLMTALCLLRLDQDREESLARLRREGIPVVFKL